MAFHHSLKPGLVKFRFPERTDDAFYRRTDKHFREYFAARVSVDKPAPGDMNVAIALVFSWMGRAKLSPKHLDWSDGAENALRRIRANFVNLDAAAIKELMPFVGSVIAVSKFLYFLEPARFAIWDSNVARAGYRLRHHSQINKPALYIDYLKDLRALKVRKELLQSARELLGADASLLRQKEYVLFHLGKRLSKKRKKGGRE